MRTEGDGWRPWFRRPRTDEWEALLRRMKEYVKFDLFAVF